VVAIGFGIFEQVMLLQGFNELFEVAFGGISAHFKLLADFIDNCRSGCPSFKKLEDSRTDEVEIEHLALPDIEHYGAILAMRTANAFCNSIHRKAPLESICGMKS